MRLDRLRRLLSLVSSPTSLHAYLESNAAPELPPGCSVELELEAKDLLAAFLPRGALEVERVYRELVLSRGERPSAGELYRMGYRAGALRRAHSGWFSFVAREGALDADERRALDAAGAWFDELEASTMTKCFKLVVLEVLLEADALTTGLPLDALAQRSLEFIQRSPELQRDLEGVGPFSDPATPQASEWRSFWLESPIADWTRGRGWFALDGDRFVPRRLVVQDGLEATLARMTRELVDYRLAMYRARTAADVPGTPSAASSSGTVAIPSSSCSLAQLIQRSRTARPTSGSRTARSGASVLRSGTATSHAPRGRTATAFRI